MTRITIGTRGSDLALAQTRMVAAQLQALAPEVEIAIEIISSTGDRVQHLPLPEMGGKGLFTKELEDALLDRRIDAAVHSLKDLPTELPAGLCLGAISEREDVRDVLVSREGRSLAELPAGAKVGTSSLRRRVQLLALRPDLETPDIRGNVPTRIAKVREGQYDATILALAGLKRLGLEHEASEILPHAGMLPAPGQGALGIECREEDSGLRALLARLNHAETAAAVTAERAVLSGLGGGCSTPLGAWARVEDGQLVLDACISGDHGGPIAKVQLRGALEDARALGDEAARRLQCRPASKALAGQRIVVTRPRSQSSQLVELLEGQGAEVLIFPTIAIVPVDPPPPIPGAAVFDWIVFTSANTVSMLAYVLSDAERSIDSYRHCRICTVGPATAERCRDYGLTVSLTPERFLGAAIADAMESLGPLAGKRILMPRGQLADESLSAALTEKGAQVVQPIVYRTEAAVPTKQELEALDKMDPHWVLFTSASTAKNFKKLAGEERIAKLSGRTQYAAIGPSTREAAEAEGLPIALMPQQHDVPGLVSALVAHVQQ
jgi:hydroxymethylbilane synthase